MSDLQQLSNSIVEFYEKLSNWEHAIVKESGFSLSQMHAIEKIGITTGSLTVAIDKLEKRGVVVRTPNPDDRRSCVIELTAVGQEVHREHSHYHLNMTQECTAGFSESEKEQFALFIQRFLQNV